MKHFILFFSLLLIHQMNAKEIPFQDGEGIIKTKAKELTKKYLAEIGLDDGKTTQFTEIVAAYMMRKESAKKLDVSDSDRKVMLKQLSIQENEDMAALLSKGQYKKYLKSKLKLQP